MSLDKRFACQQTETNAPALPGSQDMMASARSSAQNVSSYVTSSWAKPVALLESIRVIVQGHSMPWESMIQ